MGLLWRARSIRSIAAFDLGNRNISGGDRPERVMTALAVTDLFGPFGLRPALGRGFTTEELKACTGAGISPRDGLRAKEPLAEELGLVRDDVTDDEVLDAMIEHPILINRPLVETEKGVRLCRPQDLVRDIL